MIKVIAVNKLKNPRMKNGVQIPHISAVRPDRNKRIVAPPS